MSIFRRKRPPDPDPDDWTPERRLRCDLVGVCDGDEARYVAAWSTYERCTASSLADDRRERGVEQ